MFMNKIIEKSKQWQLIQKQPNYFVYCENTLILELKININKIRSDLTTLLFS